jgi:transposase InsO family protein
MNEEKVVPKLTGNKETAWYLDSGASNHMTGNREKIVELDNTVHGRVRFGDGSAVEICGRGVILMKCLTGEHRVLSNVYFIPRLKNNIISLGQLEENGCKYTGEDGVLTLWDRQRNVLARVPRTRNRMYILKIEQTEPVCLLGHAQEDAWIWHVRYGHINFRCLHNLAANSMVEGLPHVKQVNQICDGCMIAKQRRLPFPAQAEYRAEKPLDLWHGDLCGPISPATHGGKEFFLLLVDDYSRYMWLVLLKSKDEASAAIRKVQAAAEREKSLKLKALRTDRGGEFNSIEFAEYCEKQGIKHFRTAPYTPQQNGVVERRNQTVVAMARSLLNSMGMPAKFRGEAVSTAVYLLNRAPTKSVKGQTPYEAWHGKKPSVQHLRTFGCTAHVKKLGPGQSKLADRSKQTVFFEEKAKDLP